MGFPQVLQLPHTPLQYSSGTISDAVVRDEGNSLLFSSKDASSSSGIFHTQPGLAPVANKELFCAPGSCHLDECKYISIHLFLSYRAWSTAGRERPCGSCDTCLSVTDQRWNAAVAVNTVQGVEVRPVLPYRETGTCVFTLIKTRTGAGVAWLITSYFSVAHKRWWSCLYVMGRTSTIHHPR